jgi:hypothetical protein
LNNQEERNLYAMSEQEKQGFIPSFYGRKGMWIDEGDDYYTIEDGDIVHSCWDDVSQEFYTPDRKYFATKEEAQKFINEELFPKLVTILKDIQDDVKDYQTENGIGMMDDIQWQQLLVERIIASVESFNYNLK